MVTVLLSIGSIAVAQPTGNPSFVPVSTSEPSPPSVVVETVIVELGDHLWKISEEHLAGVLGRSAEDAEIDPYWRTVIEANRNGLRSGDPDLIYPGEVVKLPPTG